MKQGELLKIRLKKKGLSLDVVAKKMGISRATLYNLFEKEEITDFYLDKFKKLGVKLPEADEEPTVPPVKAAKRELNEATERLRIAIVDLKNNRGVSLQAMADKTGMPHQNVFNVKQGNNNATEPMIKAMCEAYGIRKEYIYLGQGSMYEGQSTPSNKGGLSAGFMQTTSKASALKQIPMYENVDALGGKIDIFVDNNSAYVTGYADIPNLSDSDAIIKISGDSMYPRYKAGDLIAIKRIHDFGVIQYGQPHVIVTAEQRLVKYLRRSHDKAHWLLCSENKAHYDDFEIEITKVKHLFLIRGLVRFENL